MRIVADEQIPLVAEMCGHLGEVRLVSSEDFNRVSVRDADALLVRSEWRIDASVLEGSAVRFVGSATSGTDHVDRDHLAAAGIHFADAGGCNSNSVAEYVVTALAFVACSRGLDLRKKTLGVVGVGRIGSLVARAARFLGMNVLLNDPPRAEAEGAAGFVEFEELRAADFVTLHVPLVKSGPHPTLDLLDGERFAVLKPSTFLINTSRGMVIDESALKQALRRGRLGGAVLDVWRNEPGIDFELLELVELATPHIAGYSLDGKLKSTRAVYEALCWFLGASPEPCRALEEALSVLERTVDLTEAGPAAESLCQVLLESYDIGADDRSLRQLGASSPEDRAAGFRDLRNYYRFRSEFPHSRVIVGDAQFAGILEGLGFTVKRPTVAS